MIYNYNTLFPPSPMVCSPLPVLPLPMAHPMTPLVPEQHHNVPAIPLINHLTELKPSTPSVVSVAQLQRPASQATSVKAEPGSGMGSITSANKVSFHLVDNKKIPIIYFSPRTFGNFGEFMI